MTLSVPESPLLSLKPTLLLAFKRPLAVEGLMDVVVTSQHLHPNTQVRYTYRASILESKYYYMHF